MNRPGRRRPGRGWPGRGRPGRASVAVLVLGLYTLGAVVGLAHSWAHPATVVIGGGIGDPAQTAWYLRFVPWAIGGGHDPFTTRLGNWPYGLDLLDQTSVLALGVVLAPVTLAFGPVAAYTTATTLAYVTSAGAGYLLCRRVASWRPAAFAGGLLYGFSPYMVAQGPHLNLCFVPLPPLMFLVVDDLVVRGRRPAWLDGLALAGLSVVQFLVSTEVLATTAMFGLLTVVALAVRHPRRVAERVARLAQGLVVAAGAAGVVLAWPAYVLFRGSQHIPGVVIGFRYYYASLLTPVLPTRNQAIGVARLDHLGNLLEGNISEDDGYLGLPLLAAAGALAVLTRGHARGRGGGEAAEERSRAVRLCAFMAALAFVLSMGTRFHLGTLRDANLGVTRPLPAALIYHVPLLDEAFPNRYALYVAMFLAVVLAGGLDALRDRLGGRRWVPAAVAVVALVPLLPAWPLPTQANAQVPSYFTSQAVDAVAPRSVALVYPYPSADAPEGQLWQASAGMRFDMPGGYFLVPGPGGASITSQRTTTASALAQLLTGPAPAHSPALASTLRHQLAAWRVSSVLVRPVGSDPVGFFTWLTGRHPDATTGGMVAWYDVEWKT